MPGRCEGAGALGIEIHAGWRSLVERLLVPLEAEIKAQPADQRDRFRSCTRYGSSQRHASNASGVPFDELVGGGIVIGQVCLVVALLGAAAVFGTDVFFSVVGRTALRRVSDAALVETMGRLHEVADRRMPIFGVIGIVAALASIAFSRASWLWALGAVAAQVLFVIVYRIVAAPVNAQLTRHARAGSVPTDARALEARWDSVIVARVFLMGLAVVALAAALVRSAR